MFLPSEIFGHLAQHCYHVVSSPDKNNNIKKVYRYGKPDEMLLTKGENTGLDKKMSKLHVLFIRYGRNGP